MKWMGNLGESSESNDYRDEADELGLVQCNTSLLGKNQSKH